MATTKEPTFEQLVKFVKDNQLNVFNEYSEQHNDNIEVYLDAETYTEENYKALFKEWQKIQPCNLSADEIKVIYDRAFEKLKSLSGTLDFADYSKVCIRISEWQINKLFKASL